ncbi:MAG: hypothetical protein JRI23_10700 [Deltaproteobacteria bacterium]|jgi:alpha-galactosidase|nr:hypothetical protein [Deltaproteobacteria bacterium]MBW2532146.1 hypothetical protein [Deltaproteobacteria bacterium]
MGADKVAVVGAGSAFFGPQVVVGLVRHPALRSMQLALHDVDGAAVARAGRLARLLAVEEGRDVTVRASTDLGECLEGARCVVVSVAIDRERTWARDRAIAARHGIEHYGENGGPGAVAHAARNLALILPVAREMQRRCPEAWLVNYTNPVPRIATALRRATSIRSVGVCHQLDFGYFIVGCLLGPDLGLEIPADCRFRWTDEAVSRMHRIAGETKALVRIVATGLNHFTWISSMTRRSDGHDLLPLLRQRSQEADPRFEPLSRRVYELFGSFPVSGDCHLAEYLPYTHNPARQTWSAFDIQAYDHDWSERQRRRRVAEVEAILQSGDTSRADGFGSERAEDVVAALLGRTSHTDEALNVPNRGAIPNLPPEAIVEVPVEIESGRVVALGCDPLPAPIAELCRRQVTINELCAAGLCDGDRGALLQALALDPMVDDPRLPEPLLDALLDTG